MSAPLHQPTCAGTRDYDALVADLGRKHRSKIALRALMAAGSAGTPALRRGLRHTQPEVRVGCCRVLDHHLDEAAIPELMENLSHADPGVRSWAMHALACDRCKQGACRPAENEVLPIAARMLTDDPSRSVRQMAVGMLGPSVHRSELALRALEHARDHDPHPTVRKMARWWTPGGPRYRASCPDRHRRRSAQHLQPKPQRA